MDIPLRDRFLERWAKYFGEAELPLAAWYTDEAVGAESPAPTGHACIIGQLARARDGETLRFSVESIGCAGGRRYLGFCGELMEHFDHFLSFGIPGQVEGERYKESPELVRRFVADAPTFQAPARYIVFKRWDRLAEQDEPLIVFFFARPDVLSGLFTLANFDEEDRHAVIAPFAAGCGTIVHYPYMEAGRDRPRAVIGMFDPSARPCVPGDTLSFAAPMSKFTRMIENMDESFLITPTWSKVRRRIGSADA